MLPILWVPDGGLELVHGFVVLDDRPCTVAVVSSG